jgi:unsaturated rhamnogalacturonyl hydrolase
VHERYISAEYEAVGERAVQGLLKEITPEGALRTVSVGTAMGDTKDFYKTIATTQMPYGQSLAVLCLTEYLGSYI